VIFKERVSNASSRPIGVSVEAEIALVVAPVANAVFDGHQLLSFSSVVAVGFDYPSLVDLFSTEQAVAVFSEGVVDGRPPFVIVFGAVSLEDGLQVDADDDPVDRGRTSRCAEDGEDGGIFAGLGQKSENAQRLRIEGHFVPVETFVGWVEKFVGGAFRFEVFDGYNDAAVVPHMKVVRAFQYLK